MDLQVNGSACTAVPGSGRSLLHVLREDLGLTGAKPACGEGLCGACTVLVDGRAVRGCVTPAAEVAGRSVTTVEGLAAGAGLHVLQRAFVEADALQCGYCTPGMLMAAAGLLSREPRPTDERIVAAMEGNICRCGAYPRIVAAIRAAAGAAS